MFNFRILFKKDSRRPTAKEIVKKLEQYEQELQQLGRDMNHIKWKKDLVEPKQWSAKYQEAMEQGQKFVFHFGNFITHLRCLQQWQHTSPAVLKEPAPVLEEDEAVLAEDDQEFLEKLKEATEWVSKQK